MESHKNPVFTLDSEISEDDEVLIYQGDGVSGERGNEQLSDEKTPFLENRNRHLNLESEDIGNKTSW